MTFSHTILFLVGLWALVDKESVEAIISVSLSSVVCILVLVIYCSQYIVVVAFTILLDIVQLGLYFPALQSINGGGDSKHFMKLHDVIVLMHYFYFTGPANRTWQFSAAYPHTLITQYSNRFNVMTFDRYLYLSIVLP